jgi:hypothetical protein
MGREKDVSQKEDKDEDKEIPGKEIEKTEEASGKGVGEKENVIDRKEKREEYPACETTGQEKVPGCEEGCA